MNISDILKNQTVEQKIKVEIKKIARPCKCGRIVEVEFREIKSNCGFNTETIMPLTYGDKLLNLVNNGWSVKATGGLQGFDKETKTIYRNQNKICFDKLIDAVFNYNINWRNRE